MEFALVEIISENEAPFAFEVNSSYWPKWKKRKDNNQIMNNEFAQLNHCFPLLTGNHITSTIDESEDTIS
ncbi:hypothetical protein J5N97_023541 [Dioscorea zingiberensis]|uniref:Uncharacterized protein n=1 Tax=Dioscorea zingiberensis TaxID=325984 RepID=A0A9D5C5F1_9LILI|nr:hypothetical protein J5N97_023541 [Dioscorea zingiberensis]